MAAFAQWCSTPVVHQRTVDSHKTHRRAAYDNPLTQSEGRETKMRREGVGSNCLAPFSEITQLTQLQGTVEATWFLNLTQRDWSGATKTRRANSEKQFTWWFISKTTESKQTDVQTANSRVSQGKMSYNETPECQHRAGSSLSNFCCCRGLVCLFVRSFVLQTQTYTATWRWNIFLESHTHIILHI